MKTIRLAAVAALALLLAFCAGTSPAFAAVPTITMPVCATVPLPGPENTLNPHAPKADQVQDTIRICETVTFPDPAHEHDKSRITDYHHDPRAFA